MALLQNDYMHNEDRSAFLQLKELPGFTAAIKLYMRYFSEEVEAQKNELTNIRLGATQLPHIYNLLPPICKELGIEVPELYLTNSKEADASTFGENRVCIILTTGLIERLNEEEITAVLAHECGHVACHHLLYHTIGRYLFDRGTTMMKGNKILPPQLAVAFVPLKMSYIKWMQASELSCDRVAALISKSYIPICSALAKITFGDGSYFENFNLESYIKQTVQDSKKTSDSDVGNIVKDYIKTIMTIDDDHPKIAQRIAELYQWSQSKVYQNYIGKSETAINEKDISKYPEEEMVCKHCGNVVERSWLFCKHCGNKLS